MSLPGQRPSNQPTLRRSLGDPFRLFTTGCFREAAFYVRARSTLKVLDGRQIKMLRERHPRWH